MRLSACRSLVPRAVAVASGTSSPAMPRSEKRMLSAVPCACSSTIADSANRLVRNRFMRNGVIYILLYCR